MKNAISRRLILCCLFLILITPAFSRAENTPRVAVLPWQVNSQENMDFVKNAMADMLTSRIGAARTEIIRPDIVKAALGDKRDINDGVAHEAGKKLKADYVLYGSLTVLGNSISLDARLLNTAKGSVTPFFAKSTGIDSVIAMTDKLSTDVLSVVAPAPPAPAVQAPAVTPPVNAPPVTAPPVNVLPTVSSQIVVAPPPSAAPSTSTSPSNEQIIVTPKESRKDYWKSAALQGMYLGMASADLRKDGGREFFILGRHNVLVVRKEADGLKIIKDINMDGGINNIAITAVEDSIYISGVRDNAPYGSVLEYKDNDYKITITGIKWMMRALNKDGSKVLIGQKFSEAGFFGKLTALKKEGSSIVAKGPFGLVLPSGLDIYSFDPFEIEKGIRSFLSLDDRAHLRLYKETKPDKWEKTWTSTDFYGGTLDYIEFTKTDPSAADKDPVYVEGGFFHGTRDGKPEIIIKRNVPGGLGRYANRPGSYVNGEIMSLSWDNGSFSENWKTKQIEGYIADFCVIGEGSERELIVLTVEGTTKLTGTPKTYVLSYRLNV